MLSYKEEIQPFSWLLLLVFRSSGPDFQLD